jgi:probable rRNA maturation factor
MELVSTIDVAVRCVGWSQASPRVERLADEAARLALADGVAASGCIPVAPLELGITLAGADEQRQLNRDYRGQDVPTNVLAFPAWEAGARTPADAPVLLGDVVLAFETVASEAAAQRKSLDDHLRHLVVHGVLHLLGFDHLTTTEAIVMERLETSILAKLGIADPYRAPARSAKGGSACHE